MPTGVELGLRNVVEDTSPELGGPLDGSSLPITCSTIGVNGDVSGDVKAHVQQSAEFACFSIGNIAATKKLLLHFDSGDNGYCYSTGSLTYLAATFVNVRAGEGEGITLRGDTIRLTSSVSGVLYGALATSEEGGTRPIVAVDLTSIVPDFIYAVSGQECNAYFESLIRSRYESAISLNAWCTEGVQDASRWTYTPVDGDIPSGDTTTTPWSMTAWIGAESLASPTISATLAIAKSTAGTGITRKMLLFADSTNHWTAELINLFEGDAMTLDLVGTRSSTENDADSESRTSYHEAVSGWTYTHHATDATSEPVISGNSTWDFGQYLTDNTITLATDDWVIFNLGINDVSLADTDSALDVILTTIAGHIETMIDTSASPVAKSIRGDVSGVRVGIATAIPPSNSQDAFGASYGLLQTRARHKRNIQRYQEWLLENYDTETMRSRGVYIVPTHLNLDTVNNMPTSEVAVNARNSTTYYKPNNAVHPASNGYWQIADSIYAFIKCNE